VWAACQSTHRLRSRRSPLEGAAGIISLAVGGSEEVGGSMGAPSR
jgi:hypothetical protein